MQMSIKEIRAQDTWQLRQAVMWPGKDISEVVLADDEQGTHYGLFGDDRLLSVVSVFVTGKQLQFRKFATATELQGQGFGSQLLQYVFAQARQKGVNELWCNARTSKTAFYKRFGLREAGGIFLKDGMEYIKMSTTRRSYETKIECHHTRRT